MEEEEEQQGDDAEEEQQGDDEEDEQQGDDEEDEQQDDDEGNTSTAEGLVGEQKECPTSPQKSIFFLKNSDADR